MFYGEIYTGRRQGVAYAPNLPRPPDQICAPLPDMGIKAVTVQDVIPTNAHSPINSRNNMGVIWEPRKFYRALSNF